MTKNIKSLSEFNGVMLERLTERQLGWLAGMVDGEGSITIQKLGGVEVCISSTAPISTVLQWMTGIGNAYDRPRGEHKHIYEWRVTSIAGVYKLLLALSSDLLIKRAQCDLVLKYCEARFAEDRWGTPVDREDYIKEIRELNRHGVWEEKEE